MANDKEYMALLRLAKNRCQPDHVQDRKRVEKACKSCFIETVRHDERVKVEAEEAASRPVVSDRPMRAQRMRAAGVQINKIMSMLGASYDEVWTWLHDWPQEQPARPSSVAHPVFVAVA